MSKTLDDSWLYAHVPEAEEAMLCALTEEEHTFSKGFARKMRGLLRRERRGRFGRAAALAGRAAAVVLAAVLLVNLVLIGTVEAYREEVWKLTLRVTERFTEFRVTGESTAPASEFVPIEPPYIPEGDEYKRGHAENYFDDIGVLILGDFQLRLNNLFPNTLNQSQKDAMIELAKWLCYEYDLEIIDSGVNIAPISTHRTVDSDTVCPGANAAPWIEEDLRQAILEWRK